MATKPTVLFVHGSWHNPNHFRLVRDLFEANRFPTECPRQPSCNADPARSSNWLESDAKCIQNAIIDLINAGKEVVVVMHSYGGVVGSQAVLEEYSKTRREADGLKGGVIQLVFLCSFIIPKGASLATALGGQLPPFIPVQVGDTLSP